MTAGLVQITDRPSALKKVEHYLKGVDTSIHRQVDIEARLYIVTLNNQFQFGIDWVHIAEAYGGQLGFGGSTLPMAIGGTSLQDSTLNGLNSPGGIGSSLSPGNNVSTLVFRNFNTAAAVNALELQGKVEVISKPRVRTLNNQTALIKVGEDKPFFNTSTIVQSSGTVQPLTSENTIVTSVTIGTILSLTPQISDDDWISMDISPVLTSLIGTVYAPASGSSSSGNQTSGTTAPDLETKQASTLVRVRDGTTVVLGGLIQTQRAKQLNKIPLLGDIPLLGKLFTGTFDYKQKQELVIFVTPHIVREDEVSAKVGPEEQNQNHRLIEPSTDHPARVLEGVPGPEWPQVGR
jgi:MSHA type pilus biogenesis protein MshL